MIFLAAADKVVGAGRATAVDAIVGKLLLLVGS
jgi:hypothetical protein